MYTGELWKKRVTTLHRVESARNQSCGDVYTAELGKTVSQNSFEDSRLPTQQRGILPMNLWYRPNSAVRNAPQSANGPIAFSVQLLVK